MEFSPQLISLDRIKAAQAVLAPVLAKTPVFRSASLSEILGADVYLKMETFQPVGSFKIRGATYKISQLTPGERKAGVIAASAGNHAQGVAWGAKRLGVSAWIVMPKTASINKVQSTKALGAEVYLSGETYDQAYENVVEKARQTGRTIVHPFEDPDIIAGQGTAALELVEQVPDLDYVVGSVGGGGLMAGIGRVYRDLKPNVKIIACQAAGAASMVRSMESRQAIQLNKIATFADGIAVAKTSDSLRKTLEPMIDQWVEVDDESIAAAVLVLLEKAKILSEGAAAISWAAAEKIGAQLKGKKVGIIICGGNIDVNLLSRIIDRGLIRTGRKLRINVWVSDRPGSLARLTDAIGSLGANILQAIHDRDEPSTTIDQTEVALTLETRGPDHTEQVIEALRKTVIRLDVVK